MQLTNQQILATQDAIAALDGSMQTLIVDGKPVQVFKGYKIDPKTRWDLARNAGKLQSAIADFNRAKTSLINQHTDGKGSIGAAHPNFNAFALDYEKLTQLEVEINLLPVPLAALNLQEPGNEFPISVLNALQPLILDGSNPT